MTFFPNSTINVEQVGNTIGYSDIGDPIYGPLILVKENLKVTLVRADQIKNENVIHYGSEGQTPLGMYVLTCSTFLDFKTFHRVRVLTTSNIELKSQDILLVSQTPYVGDVIKHVKVLLKFGTENG